MEKRIYKIGRLTYSQTELTWAQDKALAQFVTEQSARLPEYEKVSFMNLQQLLVKYDLLGEFLGIILIPKKNLAYWLMRARDFAAGIFQKKIPRGRINIDAASNSLLGEIFQDFFFLNKTWLQKLKKYAEALGLIASWGEQAPGAQSKISASGKGKAKKSKSSG